MNNIKILHIFEDEKFFDSTSLFFDRMDDVENLYAYYSYSGSSSFRYIKSKDKIKMVYDRKEYYKLLSDPSYDFVYLHGLQSHFYDYVLKVSDKAKVIWWSWGFDIYYGWKGCRPLLNVDLYKPLTLSLLQKKRTRLYLKDIVYALLRPYYSLKRKKVLSRIDYFTPVLSTEYQMLKEACSFFHAKPFMLYMGPGNRGVTPFEYRPMSGNVLIGNSLSYTNNHLDVFNAIANCALCSDQKFIVPVSYGGEFDINILKKSFDAENVLWLESFMPLEDYMKIFASVSYAVFGMLRQQAMGNINACLRSGIKVFLYRESIIYQHLTTTGYKVFAIENMDEESFKTPLDEDSARHNYNLLMSKVKNRHENAKNELLNML